MSDPSQKITYYGDSQVQQKLVKDYYPALLKFTKKRVPTKEDAEEIALDCFRKMFLKPLSFESSQKFRAYLYQTARNAISSFHRDNNPKISTSSHTDVETIESNLSDEDIATEVLIDEWLSVIRMEIFNQPTKRRAILIHRIIEGKEIVDIANLENISVSTVHDHIRAFKTYLINKYIHWPFDSPPIL